MDPETGRVTVGVADSAFGAVDRFDHPVPSFLAAGLALGTGRPLTVETISADGDRADYLVTCRPHDADGREGAPP